MTPLPVIMEFSAILYALTFTVSYCISQQVLTTDASQINETHGLILSYCKIMQHTHLPKDYNNLYVILTLPEHV